MVWFSPVWCHTTTLKIQELSWCQLGHHWQHHWLSQWQPPVLSVMTRQHGKSPWWRHQMETFSALLALCVGNSPVTGEFPAQSPVTRSFDVFFDLHLNKRLSKQSWGWWFETPWCPLWCHCNDSFQCGGVWYYEIQWWVLITKQNMCDFKRRIR